MPTSAQRTSVIVASGLTPATKLVLLHLLSIATRPNRQSSRKIATTSTAKIAAACDLTDRGVRKSLVMLEDAGLAHEEPMDTRGTRAWALNAEAIDALTASDGDVA